MKRFLTCAIVATMIITAVIATGCSQTAAVPAADVSASAQAEQLDAAGDIGEPSAEVTSSEEATIPESAWTNILDIEITHPTNIVGFLNETIGITVGYNGEVHCSNDAGQTWPEAENSSKCLFGLDIVDDNLIWAAGNGNNIRVSNDGGQTWSAVSDIDLGGKHSYIDFLDDKIGWVASLSKLAVTIDGATTWTQIELPEGASSIAAISLRTPKDGYLLSHDGLLFITTDSGATWSSHDLGLKNFEIVDMKQEPKLSKNTIALADIAFTDEHNGTVVFIGMLPGKGFKTVCLATSDGGATWESEVIPDAGFAPAKVFFSSDGKYLTLSSNTNQTVVFKHEG
jgi:photosystem II stability/assembly factor-like uncharacterized protein